MDTPDQNKRLDVIAEEQRLIERQHYLNTILKTLHEVSLMISKDTDRFRIQSALPQILVRNDGFKMAWIILSESGKSADTANFAGLDGYPDIYESFIREQKLPPCLVPLINKSGCQIIETFPVFHSANPDELLAGYAYPVRIKKHLSGFLVVAFNKIYATDLQHIQLFEEIALDVVTALYYDQLLVRLRESEQKFRLLFERSADAQLIIKGDVFIECNDAMMAIIGAERKEDLIGLTPWEVSPDFQPDGSNSRSKALDMINSAEGGQSLRFEWMHMRFDGTDVPVEMSLTPLNFGSESFIHVAMRDISDRKKAEKELRVANQLFQLIMDNTPDMIWIRDLDLNLTYINRAIERIKGFTRNEAFSRKLIENITPASYEVYIKALREELAREGEEGIDPKRVGRFKSEEYKKDGSLIPTETLAAFIRDEHGAPTGMLGITRDISEQQQLFLEIGKAREKAEESDRLKSAFLANMSHEIRTPMNSILGFAELLGEEEITYDERKQYISIIQSGTNQLLSIISDIIDISKIQAGQVVLHPEKTDLDQLTEQMVINFRLDLIRANKGHIRLERNCTCHLLPGKVMVDIMRLGQVMGNLLSNAIKFTDTGSITIGCTNDENFIRFFVADTGTGISPEYQNVIFERFRQVEETLTRNYSGTGLGLAICHGLVSLMGGEIGVNSELGKGSEFWFTLPLAIICE